jgi:predicted enzyme related to lactoylglutathione lyase
VLRPLAHDQFTPAKPIDGKNSVNAVTNQLRGNPARSRTGKLSGSSDVGTPTFSLEVITLPVNDVDQALRFYVEQVGFTLDVDYAPTDSFRVVQLTPPGSSCSIQLGTGLTDAPAGSVRNVYLVVGDLEAARNGLVERGVTVSEIRHKTPIGAWDGGFAQESTQHVATTPASRTSPTSTGPAGCSRNGVIARTPARGKDAGSREANAVRQRLEQSWVFPGSRARWAVTRTERFSPEPRCPSGCSTWSRSAEG